MVISSSLLFDQGGAPQNKRTAYRPACLKYFKSGGDWPLRVSICKIAPGFGIARL